MSVLVVNRKESRFEAISFAVDLHDMLIELMQRSFGLRSVEQFVRKRFARGAMTEDKIIYYRQLIHEAKKRIDEYASMLTSNVRAANTIYPTNMDEYYTRRGYQKPPSSTASRLSRNCSILWMCLRSISTCMTVTFRPSTERSV